MVLFTSEGSSNKQSFGRYYILSKKVLSVKNLLHPSLLQVANPFFFLKSLVSPFDKGCKCPLHFRNWWRKGYASQFRLRAQPVKSKTPSVEDHTDSTCYIILHVDGK